MFFLFETMAITKATRLNLSNFLESLFYREQMYKKLFLNVSRINTRFGQKSLIFPKVEEFIFENLS